MNLNYRTFIGLFSFLLCGLFSVDSFAALTSSQAQTQCNAAFGGGNYCNNYPSAPTASSSCNGSWSYYSVSVQYTLCDGPPPCPAAGTPYTGYYPSGGAATDTVLAPNGTTSTCAVAIDNTKTSCPPNTVMPTFGTVETPACIVTGTYTGSAGPSGAQSNAASAPSSSSDCPTGTGSYSISNGTSTITGCGVTSKSTTSNPSATPAATTTTGTNSTSTTTTTVNETTTTNSNGSTTTTGTTTSTNDSACGGAGQPACNVNSTCGGPGQPACNTNIGDSTFTVFTPTTTNPIFTDNTQGTVSTSSFSIGNYISSSTTTCPVTDQTGEVFGQSFTLPFSEMCTYLDWIKYIVIVAAAIASMKLL